MQLCLTQSQSALPPAGSGGAAQRPVAGNGDAVAERLRRQMQEVCTGSPCCRSCWHSRLGAPAPVHHLHLCTDPAPLQAYLRTQQLRTMIEWGRAAMGRYHEGGSTPGEEGAWKCVPGTAQLLAAC